MQALGYNILISLGRRQLDVHGFMACLGLRNEVGQREISIWTSHEVAMVILQQVILHTFCHTAQYADDEGIS